MAIVFGPYELGELLGRGGMGEVFRAYDTVRDRTVALKVLPQHLAQDESFTARFRRESRLAAQLNEAHIIPIHDFGEIDGRLFIDMRLVEGQDLSALLESRGALPVEVAVEVIAQLASALDAAHERGLVHRDVKPSNVLLAGLRHDPAHVPFAYLVDFGIARAINSQNTGLKTTQGTTVGTIAYMAPERIAGEAGDARVDIYAMACVLYEALTGTVPFGGETFAIMYAHVNAPIPRAAERVGGIPPELDDVIARGLAKDPDDRYATAGEFAAAAQGVVRAVRGAMPMPGTGPTPTGTADADDAQHRATRIVSVNPGFATPPPGYATPGGYATPPPGYVTPPPGYVAQPPVPPRRRRRTARAWIAATLAVLIVAAVVGVVLVTRDEGTDGSRESSGGPLAATPRSAVRDGGSMTWAIASKIKNFNLFTVDGAQSRETRLVDSALLPTPFHFDHVAAPSVDTDYFTSIEQVSANPMAIEYKINPKARWSDGSSITYRDFQAQFEALTTFASGVVSVPGYSLIESVGPRSTTDERDVLVTFKSTFSDWQNLFSPLLPISLTQNRTTFAGAWEKKPAVTAGPFRWGGVIGSGSRYTVNRDPSWWGPRPMLDSIVFVAVAGASTVIKEVRAHHVDYGVLNAQSPAQVAALARDSSRVDVRQDTPAGGFRTLVLNAAKSPLNDPAVRQAIAHAVDRQRVARSTFGADAVALQNHFFSPGVPPYKPTCGDYCAPDVAAARAVLESDGWRQSSGGTFTKDGQALKVSISVPDNSTYGTEANVVSTALTKAGFQVSFAGVAGADFPQMVTDATYEMTLYDDNAGRFPLSSLLNQFRHSGALAASYNRNGAGSSEIDALLDKAEQAASPAARDAALNAVSAAMWGNAVYLPLYTRNVVAIVNSDLVNVGAFGLGDVRWSDVGYRK